MNIIDKLFVDLYASKQDLWWKNRRRNFTETPEGYVDQPLPLIKTEHGLILDLNLYRPGRNLKALLDAGVDGFIFRMGGPSQWVEGDWRYKEDPTWRGYMDQAKALGIANQCGGYIIHNPFEDWHLQGIISNVHLNLINQWTSGGYMPGYLIVDHEVAECWRGATKITCTTYNLVESLGSITDQIWKIFKKVPMIYTGRWFIDKFDKEGRHVNYFDGINKVEKQRPMWYAGYPAQSTFGAKTYTDLKAALEDVPTPSAAYVGSVLQCGSYSMADSWQFTDRLKLVGDSTGVDASVTWGTWAQYCAAVNVTATPPTPPEPPEPPTPDDDLTARVAKLEAQVAALEQFKANVKGA